MKKWGIIGGAGLLVVIVVVVVIMRPSKPEPEAPKEAGPTGPDPAHLAKIAELIKRAEDFEAKGRFADALQAVKQLAALEPGHPQLSSLKSRLEEKLRRFEAWKKATELADSAQKDAARRDTVADWQKVIDLCAEADRNAPSEEHVRQTRALSATAHQRRDWVAARDEEKKGNLAGALDLVAKAISAREAPPELTAYKASLEKKKRKFEFDRVLASTRTEAVAARQMEFLQQARGLADDPKDIEDIDRRIHALKPKVDPAERDRRHEAAMKAGEEALAAGKFEEAQKAFREAQSLKVEDLKPGQALTRVEAARRQKTYDTALAEAGEAESKKEWGRAIDALDRALKIKSGDAKIAARRKELETTHWPPKIVLILDESTGIKMEFARVRRGTYRRGDAQGDSDEKPQDVTIAKDFWMQTTEATQAQWSILMGIKTKPWNFSGASDMPVEGASWLEVQKFIEKLNEVTKEQLKGRKAGLPTEAEWEYACRAGTHTRFNFGNEESDLEAHGWFTKNAPRSTQSVGKKRPNAWGLYDMHGNVAEWCDDWYASDPEKAPDAASADAGQHRSIRGGNWNDRAGACRSANRERDLPTKGSMFVGFRVVLR